MKLLVLLFLIIVACAIVYFTTSFRKKINWKALTITGLFGLALLSLMLFAMYQGSKAPDTWCTTIHSSTSYPPAALKTSTDYFESANYKYDTGRCKEAVADYTKSIELNSKYPQAFNNRAYTYMRMENYKSALSDLDKALALNPNYVNALMNRGDIHNYHFEIDKGKAITDYEKIISIAGTKGTNVCGHLAMARRNNINPITYISALFEVMDCREGR
jgi:tetratricopeptide (TPR) repeat protein